MATVMDCKALSESIIEDLKERVSKLNAKGKSVGLATIVVGDDPASAIYVHNKEKACKELGIFAETIHLPASTTQRELEATIDRVMRDGKINGAIVQLPLPEGLDENKALIRVFPEKDADGFHINNIGRLSKNQEGLVPCTPKGIMRLLEEYEIPMEGKKAVVVGRSNIVGKPIAMMLLNKDCTVTVCHSKTENLAEITAEADILVVAVGSPKLITADMVKEGAVVIDVGVNRTDDGIVGDVDFDEVEPIAGYITKVPGGVGKMTVAMLMQNVVEMAENMYFNSYNGNIYEL